MFDKIQQGKQLMQMRSQAKKLQRELEEVTETVEKGPYKVKVTGAQSVEYLEIDGEPKDELVKAINDAFKKVQKRAAQKMMEEKGLSGLLGGLGK